LIRLINISVFLLISSFSYSESIESYNHEFTISEDGQVYLKETGELFTQEWVIKKEGELWTKKYGNGQIDAIGTSRLIGGRRFEWFGPYKSYYLNGNLWSEGIHGNNEEQIGLWRYYHENGMLRTEQICPNGPYKDYDENGKLIEEGIMINCIREEVLKKLGKQTQ